MTAVTIRPPHQMADGHTQEWPHVFLAGPIQGAPNWQKEAVAAIHHHEVVIANPRCFHRHDDYNSQVDWELKNLRRAAQFGAVFFWLAKPDPNQKQPEGRAYAQTSRFELGEWVGRFAESDGWGSLVVGIEDGFSNERYIRRRLGHLWPEMVIPSTLGGTLEVLNSEMGW